MVTILMMSAKVATLGLLEIKVTVSNDDITTKSRDLDYIADVVM